MPMDTDNMINYLETPIESVKETDTPRYGICADGYTRKSGAPTSKMVKLKGEKIWRRLMVICFSNCGSLFLNIKGKRYFISEYDLPPSV